MHRQVPARLFHRSQALQEAVPYDHSPAVIKVHGVSLHYFNEAGNNDKYYRAFVWQDAGAWHVAYHWGRDGGKGQTKPKAGDRPDSYRTEDLVKRALKRKVDEKLREGYQFLGQGDIEIDAYDVVQDAGKIGDLLHARVGREPLKLPTGFQLVIREEEDIEDLLCQPT